MPRAGSKLQSGRKAGLAVVLVGEDPASQVYVRSKGKATIEAGMASFEHRLPADTGQAELLALVARLNADPAVDGILVQLPLPAHIGRAGGDRCDRSGQGRRRAYHRSTPGGSRSGLPGLVPCTPLGCLMLLQGPARATCRGWTRS